MGVDVDVAIGVGLCLIHLIRERSTLLSGDQYIKKRNGFILLDLHGKFNVR